MPRYTFKLRDGSRAIEDEAGVDLPGRERALAYARDVIGELMSCREKDTRSWRLDVYEEGRERIFEIVFASVDATLDHLSPEFRSMMVGLCERKRSLQEAVHAAQATLRESRALLARARGKPYLATLSGERVIRLEREEREAPGPAEGTLNRPRGNLQRV